MEAIPFRREDAGALLVILLFVVLRLVVAPSFGLGVDEAHYVLYARHLDLAYVDHPPLVGWVHWVIMKLFGLGELQARLPAVLLFALTSWFVYAYTRALSRSLRLAFLALLAVNASFILNVLGLMLLPDCFLLALVFPVMETVLRVEKSPTWGNCLLLGLLLGLAGLAKYTAVLLVPPIVGYFLIKRRLRVLFSLPMVCAALLALVVISPVIVWNWRHDFISFRYQSDHVLARTAPSAKSFLVSLLAQCGAYSPFLFVVAFFGFFKSLRVRDDRLLLACLIGGTVLLFFLYGSLYERTLPHWPSLFYLLFIPAGVCFLARGGRFQRNFLFFSIGFSLSLTLFLYAELQAKWFAFPDYRSPFRDIYGFETVAADAAALLARDGAGGKKAVAVTNWTMGSRMAYYLIPWGRESFVVDRRRDQFDLWEGGEPLGYDLLFVTTHFHDGDVVSLFRCDGYEEAGGRDIVLNGGKVDTYRYRWCRNFQGWR
ncbi:MAG TPA: glycosyltransferase family 39 protein [Syntrophales bacterium]|nr:glycosyltransferase family 39 protein [Syntrophales bacterium]HOM07650.1 glycosyltransferase family 39 protein [Syntrophales bacterium]HOO00313.1 glycosyltransferase family 39 protein [Syntrophales bacterium]HPC01209.1 glycosyltransferase family 39 protein [Syntrophales bacterium]HPQ07208.1 glycosyltransferase family 39 protein [Syntrophales bacterium]